MKFQTNIGGLDKGIRIGVGALLIVLALLGVIGWGGGRGVIPPGPASARFCPLYALFGINTCPLKSEDE